MGLWIGLYDPTATYTEDSLYSCNITHNLGGMAEKAGLYKALWRPYMLDKGYYEGMCTSEEYSFEDSVVVVAEDIIPIVEKGLKKLKAKPEYYKKFDSPNGWGLYEHFVPFVEEYLEHLKIYPKAIVKANR